MSSDGMKARGEPVGGDPILLSQIVDQIFLVTIQPASDDEDKEVQRRGHPVRLRRWRAVADVTPRSSA